MSKEPTKVAPPRRRRRSADEKLRLVQRANELIGDELGEFLRQDGVHAKQLEQWREVVHEALGDPPPESRRRERETERENKAPWRELRRKEKALAELAALIWLTQRRSGSASRLPCARLAPLAPERPSPTLKPQGARSRRLRRPHGAQPGFLPRLRAAESPTSFGWVRHSEEARVHSPGRRSAHQIHCASRGRLSAQDHRPCAAQAPPALVPTSLRSRPTDYELPSVPPAGPRDAAPMPPARRESPATPPRPGARSEPPQRDSLTHSSAAPRS